MEPGRAGWLLLLLLLPALGAAAPGEFDPYRVLGVGRSSSQADIKKAYKRLAREWYVLPLHPLRPAPGADPGLGPVTAPGPAARGARSRLAWQCAPASSQAAGQPDTRRCSRPAIVV